MLDSFIGPLEVKSIPLTAIAVLSHCVWLGGKNEGKFFMEELHM